MYGRAGGLRRDNPAAMTTFSQPVRFTDAEHKSDAFERLLKELGIEIALGGALEQLHLHLKELADWHTGKRAATATSEAEVFAGADGRLIACSHEAGRSPPPSC